MAADKGCHANEQLTTIHEHTPYQTYIPEPELKHDRKWTAKPPEQKKAVYANRRRTRGKRGKRLQRLRSERVEWTFAHVCETGGARRTWLVGIDKVRKRYLISAAAHNLSVMMRILFRKGTPQGLQRFGAAWSALISALHLALLAAMKCWTTRSDTVRRSSTRRLGRFARTKFARPAWKACFSTVC